MDIIVGTAGHIDHGKALWQLRMVQRHPKLGNVIERAVITASSHQTELASD